MNSSSKNLNNFTSKFDFSTYIAVDKNSSEMTLAKTLTLIYTNLTP